MDNEHELKKRKQRLRAVFEGDSSLPAENLDIVEEYLSDMELENISDYTLWNNYDAMIIFCRFCKTPIPKLTERDVKDFARYLKDHTFKRGGKEMKYSVDSRRLYKMGVNRFFVGYLKRDDLAGLMKKLLKNEISNEENPKRAKRNLLTEEEVYKKMIPAAATSRDKALVSVFYECGARRGEVYRAKVCHINFNSKFGCEFTIPCGKTGPRPEPLLLIRSRAYLRAWLEQHPMRDENGDPDPEAPLFVTVYTKPVKDKQTGEIKHVYTQLSENGIHKQLKEIAKRAGIKKPVSSHQMRHACATRLAEECDFNIFQLDTQMGWSKKSNTAAAYVHDVSVQKKIKKLNGIEDDDTKPKETTRICPNCKERVDIYANFCPNCGYGDDVAQQDICRDFSSTMAQILEMAKESPEVQKMLFGLAEKLNKGEKA